MLTPDLLFGILGGLLIAMFIFISAWVISLIMRKDDHEGDD